MCTFLSPAFSFRPFLDAEASGNVYGNFWGEKRQAEGKKGKFNFRNPKFLFYDYTEFVVGGVSVCAGASVEGSVKKELAHS